MEKNNVDEYIPFTGKEEAEAAAKAIDQGWISPKGSEVGEFERMFSNFTGTEHATATDSGTASLHLALEALDLDRNDEVIIPDFTYGATGLAVTSSRLKPVIADIERPTLGLDPESIKENISSNTEAILVAHMFGKAADMDAITDIAEDHDLYIVEDTAQALDASFKGNKAGSIGDIGCFSFAWSKNITTGKGGITVTDSKEIAQRIQKLADYGRNPEDRFEFSEAVAYNYKMDNIRAAIGITQMKKFKDILKRKRNIFQRYRSQLGSIEEIKLLPKENRENYSSAPSIFGIYTDRREELISWLEQQNIGTRRFFPPLHEMSAFSQYESGDCSVSREVSQRGLGLPSHPDLKESDIKHVTDSVKQFFNR